MKTIKLITISILFLFFLGFTAQAQGLQDAFGNETLDVVATTSGYNITESSNGGSIENMIGAIIRIVISILGVLFIIIAFFAANKWMTANGNEEEVKKAQSMLKNAIIGLIVILAAYALSNTLTTMFADLLVK